VRLNLEKRESLKRIRFILKASCHADGCENINTCPNQCKCRYDRTFKLNTETAMCWEIGDEIWDLLKYQHPSRGMIDGLVETCRAYEKLSRFHMTKGWENFLRDLAQCIQALTNPPTSYTSYIQEEGYINELKGRLKRLKRYPKEG